MGLTDFFQHGVVDADLRIEAVNGAWPAVELIGNRIERLLAVNRQIRAFGQVLSDKHVDVLVTAALPGAVWIAEVDFDARIGCRPWLLCHRLALVVGQRLAHRLGNAAPLGRKAFQRRRGRGVHHLGKHHQARAVLDQHTQHSHCRAVARPLDEITLPVPGKYPVAGFGRARMDAQHHRQLAPAVFAARTRNALALGAAQTGNQVFAQLPAGHGVGIVVDGLVRDGALGIIRLHALECACGLERRPALGEKVVHHAKEQGVDRPFGATPGLEVLPTGSHTGSPGVVCTIRFRHKGTKVQRSCQLAYRLSSQVMVDAERYRGARCGAQNIAGSSSP